MLYLFYYTECLISTPNFTAVRHCCVTFKIVTRPIDQSEWKLTWGMIKILPREDAFSSGHLVLSHLGLAFVHMLRPFFPELVIFTDLLSFEHPSVLLFYYLPLKRFIYTKNPLWYKNKTNHSIMSSIHPSAAANKSRHLIKGGDLQNQRGHNRILTNFVAVHMTTVSENDYSSGIITKFSSKYAFHFLLKTKRRRSDPVLWQKPLHQQTCQKGKVTTQTTPIKI